MKRGFSKFISSLLGLLLTYCSPVLAEEIEGTITSLTGPLIQIDSTSDLLPAVNDRVEIFVEVPGVGKASVATAKVSGLADEIIQARIENATGKVKLGQAVVITSASPKRRVGTKVPRLIGRTGAEAKKALQKSGLVAKFQVGVPAPEGVTSFTVMDQAPKHGKTIARGGTVTVTLYGRGNTTDPVPMTDTTPRSNSTPAPRGKASNSELVAGDEVVVIRDAQLAVGGKTIDKVWPGLVMTIGERNGQWLWLSNGKPGWLDQSHVIPLNEAAIDRLTALIGGDSKNARIYNGRGTVRKALGQLDAAISDFTEAIRLDPKQADYYNNRGLLWIRLMEYDKAIEDLTKTLKLNPRHDLGWNNRGLAWLEKGKYDNAIADLTEALRLEPKFVHAYNNRSSAWNEKGEHDRALADLNEALRLDPKYALAMLNRAWTWRKKRNLDEALKDYKEALRLDPGNPDILAMRGHLWKSQGQFAKALADYNEALRFNPQHALSLGRRGWVLATCPDATFRDGTRALADATRAWELTRGKADWIDAAVAAAHAELGDFDKAISWQTKALEMAKEKDRQKFQGYLATYRQGKPYREQPELLTAQAPRQAEPTGELAGWGQSVNPSGDCAITTENRKLVVKIPPGTHDLWHGRKDPKHRFNAPRVWQDVEGDFVAQVKVTADWIQPGDHQTNNGAGLVVWASETDFVRCERQVFIYQDKPTCFLAPLQFVDNQRIGDKTMSSAGVYRGNSTWLRIERKGQTLKSEYSHDGKRWISTGTLSTNHPQKVKVGIHAFNISPVVFAPRFEELLILEK